MLLALLGNAGAIIQCFVMLCTTKKMAFFLKKRALQRRYFRHPEEMMKVDMLRSCDMG